MVALGRLYVPCLILYHNAVYVVISWPVAGTTRPVSVTLGMN